MSQTSTSLLDRLRDQPEEPDWQRLVLVYTPLIRNWLKRYSVPQQDCHDLVQEVLAVVVRRIPEFEHNQRTGAFRNWLRTITVNCLRDFWRSNRFRPVAGGGSDFQEVLAQLEDPESGLSQTWNREHDLFVTQILLQQIQPLFEKTTWAAFHRTALEGISADQVAQELNVSTNAVFIAKSRVLARLRQEAKGLVDEV